MYEISYHIIDYDEITRIYETFDTSRLIMIMKICNFVNRKETRKNNDISIV